MPPSFAEYQRLPKLAVLPILPYQREPQTGRAYCLLCNENLSPGEIHPKDLMEFYHLVYFQMEKTYRFQMSPERLAQSFLPEGKSFPDSPEKWKQVYVQAFSQGVPYVLVTTLFRFEERQGDAYGVTKPASVAFDMHLIDTEQGVTIWSGHFVETQSALSENILEIGKVFERKARWLTASELSRENLQKLFLQIPVQKEKQT